MREIIRKYHFFSSSSFVTWDFFCGSDCGRSKSMPQFFFYYSIVWSISHKTTGSINLRVGLVLVFSLSFFFVFFWLRFQVYFVEICFGKLVTSLTWYVVLFDIYVFFLTCPSWYGLLYTVITKQTFLLFHCWLTDGRYLLSKISTSVYYYHPIWMPGEAGSMIISCLTGGVLTSWSLHKEHTETLHCIYVYIERDWTCVLLTFWFMARFTWTGAKYMYMSNLVMDLYEFFVKRMWFRGSVIIL